MPSNTENARTITPLGSSSVPDPARSEGSSSPGEGHDLGDEAPSEDQLALRRYAVALLEACEAALPGWVERSVIERADAWRPGLGSDLRSAAAAAGRRALDDVGPRLRAALLADSEGAVASPLSVLRTAVVHPTDVLRDGGVPEVVRDEFAVRAFPEDRYDLSPATFADVDPTLHELGLAWGAAKAHVVLARRRGGR